MIATPRDVPTVRPLYNVVHPELRSIAAAPALYRFACLDPDAGLREGLYVRGVRRPDGAQCVQVVLYYRVQRLPYHVNDFAPFFLYLDADDELSSIVHDTGHHRAAATVPDHDPRLTVVAPWHALRRGRTPFAARLRATEFPLTDDVIHEWWYERNTGAQLKLRSKLVDPWHEGLRPPGGGNGTFRDEAACPRCGRAALMDDMKVHGKDLQRSTRCPNGHRFIAVYRAQTMTVEGLPA